MFWIGMNCPDKLCLDNGLRKVNKKIDVTKIPPGVIFLHDRYPFQSLDYISTIDGPIL